MQLAFHFRSRKGMRGVIFEMITSSLWLEENNRDRVSCLYDINPSSRPYSQLAPASQISKHYIGAVLGVPNMSEVHSVVVWLHQKHQPTYLALYNMDQESHGAQGREHGAS